jgi:hypothetical protein
MKIKVGRFYINKKFGVKGLRIQVTEITPDQFYDNGLAVYGINIDNSMAYGSELNNRGTWPYDYFANNFKLIVSPSEIWKELNESPKKSLASENDRDRMQENDETKERHLK